MINQQKLAKQYSYLNGKRIKVYIGNVPCNMKHVEKELSLVKKDDNYEEIIITIHKTHFNGSVLTIIPKTFEGSLYLLPFKIRRELIYALRFDSIYDRNERELKNGDIIDLHQTVNGQNLFVIMQLNPLDIRYAKNGFERKYEYDAKELLKPCQFSGITEFEIVANIYETDSILNRHKY